MFDSSFQEFDMRNFLSDSKFYEGYSRYNDKTKMYETWEESVSRVMNMHREYYKDKMTPKLAGYIDKAETAYRKKMMLGAQRALQFGGTQLLKHHMRLYNCTSSYADRVDFFGEYFYILLCGAGAGFSVQKQHIAKLPMIRPRTKQPKLHVITDDIEGWATSVDVLLSSFFIGGGKYPQYEGRRVYFDFTAIRPKGAPISGGFKAPGPDPLMHCLTQIERLLTHIAEEGILKPINVYDICMHIAEAVLSGGVRRAATICLFSMDDDEMLNAKTGNWQQENIQRRRSNNSMMVKRGTLDADIFVKHCQDRVRQFGEPGVVFVESLEHCFNPCVEIGMVPHTEDGRSGWQGCNLTEINGALCSSREAFLEAVEAAAILGTLQAGYTNFKFLSPVSKEIFDREALLGVSITGWMNNPVTLFNEKNLKDGAELVKKTNQELAAVIGIKPAARTTCVKPAGNASVLLSTASGIHPEHSKRYIRNIQINKLQEICGLFQEFNPYMIEESVHSEQKTDYAISFPVIPSMDSILKSQMYGVEFLERIKMVQQSWVEAGTVTEFCVDPTVRHNVSNTITIPNNDEEWETVARYIHANQQFFAGISLFKETGDLDFYQAPMIEVLTPEELANKYGNAAIFASGLIVDACTGFAHLWEAIEIAQFNHDKSNQELRDIRADWVRRFKKFADNYFSGNMSLSGECLKNVAILHKWVKIQQNYHPIDVQEHLKLARDVDINTTGAMACAAGGCVI
jgi:ribonucleoside-triphosphate reductase